MLTSASISSRITIAIPPLSSAFCFNAEYTLSILQPAFGMTSSHSEEYVLPIFAKIPYGVLVCLQLMYAVCIFLFSLFAFSTICSQMYFAMAVFPVPVWPYIKILEGLAPTMQVSKCLQNH